MLSQIRIRDLPFDTQRRSCLFIGTQHFISPNFRAPLFFLDATRDTLFFHVENKGTTFWHATKHYIVWCTNQSELTQSIQNRHIFPLIATFCFEQILFSIKLLGVWDTYIGPWIGMLYKALPNPFHSWKLCNSAVIKTQ